MRSTHCINLRLYLSLALAYRYDIEIFPADIADREQTRLVGWMNSLNLVSAMSAVEKEIVLARPGSLTDTQKHLAFWAVECAGVCAWALNMWKWMRYDEPFDALDDLAEATQFLKTPRAETSLIPYGSLRDYQAMLKTCLWRLREYDRGRKEYDILKIVDKMKYIGLSTAHIQLIGGDMSAYGKSLKELDAFDYDGLYCRVQERFKAINWIMSDVSAEYSATHVDT